MPQASISAMLLSAANLHRLQSEGLTVVDLLVSSVLNMWRCRVATLRGGRRIGCG